jgi:transposase
MHVIGTAVSADAMSSVLAEFARDEELGQRRRAVVVLDGAGWHRAKDLVVPEGVHLAFLPPYSPELQPAERLWPIVNEGTANKVFNDLAELEDRLEQRCIHLCDNPGKVRAYCGYHWWPKDHPAAP